jgi:hypothetical protein
VATSTDLHADAIALWLGLHGLAHQRADDGRLPVATGHRRPPHHRPGPPQRQVRATADFLPIYWAIRAPLRSSRS